MSVVTVLLVVASNTHLNSALRSPVFLRAPYVSVGKHRGSALTLGSSLPCHPGIMAMAMFSSSISRQHLRGCHCEPSGVLQGYLALSSGYSSSQIVLITPGYGLHLIRKTKAALYSKVWMPSLQILFVPLDMGCFILFQAGLGCS